MRAKRGFALATTMVVMVVVLALSNLLLVLATNTISFAKSQTKIFETNQQYFQITQNFADLELSEFLLDYADCTGEDLGNVAMIWDNDENYCLIITDNDTTVSLEIKDYFQTKTFGIIEKENGVITLWQLEN